MYANLFKSSIFFIISLLNLLAKNDNKQNLNDFPSSTKSNSKFAKKYNLDNNS